MHFFNRSIFIVLIVITTFISGCNDNEHYFICTGSSLGNYVSYVPVGDTIPLIACRTGNGGHLYSNKDVHWIVTNPQNEIVFESYSFNSYFITDEAGEYTVTLETLKTNGKNHEKDEIIREETYEYFAISSNVVVFTTSSFGFSPIEVRLYDSEYNLLDQDTINASITSETNANCQDDYKFAIFRNLPPDDYTVEASYLQSSGSFWSAGFSNYYNSDYNLCRKIDIN